MILHEITRAVFMATHDQTICPGYHDLTNLLGTLQPPGWFENAVVPITENPCYATAMARPYTYDDGVSLRPLENQILLVLDQGSYSRAVGLYLGDVITIEPAHQRKGLSTELILRCCAHRNIPTRRTLTEAGKAALERAHRTAVLNAHAKGCHIPVDVRAEYGL